MASVGADYDVILVARSDGVLAADVRPLVRLSVNVIVEHDGKREQGHFGGGGRHDLSYFTDEHLAEYADRAVDQALINLVADPAPAGIMPVVLGPGWPGILLHEAVGHGLEGDFNRKGSSAFAGKVGQRVASKGVTVIDDGTIANRRGSLSIDDEGNATQRTVMIEDGILRGYIQDSLNARLMNVAPTGNGRRESFAHLPMPRMTNTYMLAGDKDPDEIVRSVSKGIYATNFGGGQVDITNGKFVFSMAEAYMIENGKVTRPIKGATLIGNGPDALTQVTMIGNDMALDPGIGTCGKDGQSVPVGRRAADVAHRRTDDRRYRVAPGPHRMTSLRRFRVRSNTRKHFDRRLSCSRNFNFYAAIGLQAHDQLLGCTVALAIAGFRYGLGLALALSGDLRRWDRSGFDQIGSHRLSAAL